MRKICPLAQGIIALVLMVAGESSVRALTCGSFEYEGPATCCTTSAGEEICNPCTICYWCGYGPTNAPCGGGPSSLLAFLNPPWEGPPQPVGGSHGSGGGGGGGNPPSPPNPNFTGCWHSLVATQDPNASTLDTNDKLGTDYGGQNTTRPDHSGIDIQCDLGDSVTSSGDGVVSQVADNASNGKYIRIDHPNGYQSTYLHLESQSVKVGDSVTAGQQVGTGDSTGSSTGNHLHYTLRDGPYPNGNIVNPEAEHGSCPP